MALHLNPSSVPALINKALALDALRPARRGPRPARHARPASSRTTPRSGTAGASSCWAGATSRGRNRPSSRCSASGRPTPRPSTPWASSCRGSPLGPRPSPISLEAGDRASARAVADYHEPRHPPPPAGRPLGPPHRGHGGPGRSGTETLPLGSPPAERRVGVLVGDGSGWRMAGDGRCAGRVRDGPGVQARAAREARHTAPTATAVGQGVPRLRGRARGGRKTIVTTIRR